MGGIAFCISPTVTPMRDSMYLDLPDETLAKLELGQEVELKVSGTVRELRAAYKPSKEEKEMEEAPMPNPLGSLQIDIKEAKVEGLNDIAAFDKALDEEDDE